MRNLKRVLALALALVMVIGMMVMGASAASTTEYDYAEAKAVATGSGIFVGDDKGELNWTETLTREQAAKIMAYIMLGETTAEKLVAKTQSFTDVATNRWSAKYIEYCVNAGLIAGRGDGTFDPEGELTGLAFAKLLLVALGYDADAEGYVGNNWATAIAVDAMAEGLDLDEVTLYDTVNRQQAAQMLLQVLDNRVVEYEKAFDKATNAEILYGPFDDCNNDNVFYCTNHSFGAVLLGITTTDRGYGDWGRPYSYKWMKGTKTLYTAWETPVYESVVAENECDIAEELGLDEAVTISKITLNNKDGNKNDVGGNMKLEPLATKKDIGAQGRVTEIYVAPNGTFEIVMIDTYLAVVTDVTDCTYDRNGHLRKEAVLDLGVWTSAEAKEYSKKSEENWEYTEGEWLLVNIDEKTNTALIVDYAEAMEGKQTSYTTVATHVVDKVTYDDAHTFYLDQAGKETGNHIWFFDQYDNLIGVIDPAAEAVTYAVISSIYWKDTNSDDDDGYARAQLTYMDGTQEWVTLSTINGVSIDSTEGQAGVVYGTKPVEAAEGEEEEEVALEYTVSSTKKHNAAFLNQELFEVSVKGGKVSLKAVPQLAAAEGEDAKVQLITGNKTLLKNTAYANSKTLFLIWDSTEGEYITAEGIKNIPTGIEDKDGEIAMWVASIGTNDDDAEYVFVIDPDYKAGAGTKYSTYVYYADNYEVEVETVLKSDDTINYYLITGGNIEEIKVKAAANEVAWDDETNGNETVKAIMDRIEANRPMVLSIGSNGFVGAADGDSAVITSGLSNGVAVSDETTLQYVDYLTKKCEYESDEETLYYDGEWYDVENAELVGDYDSWSEVLDELEDDYVKNVGLFIVYDEDNIVSLVYFRIYD